MEDQHRRLSVYLIKQKKVVEYSHLRLIDKEMTGLFVSWLHFRPHDSSTNYSFGSALFIEK